NLLKKDEIQTILEMSKAVISEAVHYGGTTIQSFETLGHKGSFQDHLQVHGKKGDPCPNCQTAIKKVMLKGRGTYYCPNCQRSYIIAMTGGISSGKSTVSHYLKKKGFSVFDSDK